MLSPRPQSALGVQVRVGDVWRSIVGINKNYVYGDPRTQKPTILLPVTQDYTTSAILVLRTKAEPLQMASDVRREFMAFDRYIPVGTFITMEENVATHFASDKLGSLAMMIFALVASVLAAVGIFTPSWLPISTNAAASLPFALRWAHFPAMCGNKCSGRVPGWP